MLKLCMKLTGIVFVLLIILTPSVVSAGGVSPYLPLNNSPEIERQIERLLILAGKPVMTRPIAVATVLEALYDARKKDENLCRQVEDYIQRYFHDAGLTHMRAEASVSSGDSEQVLPNQYGRDVQSSWEVSGGFFFWAGQYALVNLGGVAYDGGTSATGSMLSVGIDYAQLDIGYRDHWLSPFTDSSMLISTEARTMPSITLSNYRPITGLGLYYEVFLAEMSESDRIAYKDRYTTGNPRLAGLHLEAEPISGFAVGLNRQLQYSGGERNNDSFTDFVNALLDPSKYDNTSSSLTSDQEFGNQQASLTTRMLFPGRHPFAVYFEYAGEDTSRRQDYLLGNVSFSMGIDVPLLWEGFDLTYETTEWQNGWYRHGVYLDGMTNDDVIIGHWFGEDGTPGARGMSHMLRLGWQSQDGNFVNAVYRTLKNEGYVSDSYKRMQEMGLSYSIPWAGNAVGMEIYGGKDIYGDRYIRLGAYFDFDQDWMSICSDAVATAYDGEDVTDFFFDAGMNYTSIDSELDVATEGGGLKESKGRNAHLGLGVRRAISEKNDLGVRLEWDRVEGGGLLSFRLIDWRHRMGNRFALTGFLGVGRYALGIPAYGYYMGAGAQLLNVMPGWDLCVDWRRHMEMGRDKETVTAGTRPDEFHNMLGGTVYLSYRF